MKSFIVLFFISCLMAVLLAYIMCTDPYTTKINKYTISTDVGYFKCYDFNMVNDTCIIINNDLTPMKIYSKNIKIETNEQN